MNRIGFIEIFVNEPRKVIEFLTSRLGFTQVAGKYDCGAEAATVLENGCGNIFLVSEIRADRKEKYSIVIYTPDCLQTCFNLSSSGVKFLNPPHYTVDCLMVEIVDPYGNEYTIIEKRKISENLNEKYQNLI